MHRRNAFRRRTGSLERRERCIAEIDGFLVGVRQTAPSSDRTYDIGELARRQYYMYQRAAAASGKLFASPARVSMKRIAEGLKPLTTR